MSFKTRRLVDKKKRKPLPWKLLIKPVLMLYIVLRGVQQEKKVEAKRSHILKGIFIVLAALLGITMIGAAAAKVLIAARMIDVNTVVSVAGEELPKDRYGHTNILLLGAGDKDHDGIDLTDTVMLASIDPDNTHSVAMLSLPRDLYFLKTDKMGAGRINTLFRDYKGYLMQKGSGSILAGKAGMNELAHEVSVALGIDIHGVVKVDFTGFVEAVDALGGVDIDVPEDLVDTEYPGPNYGYETFSISAGPQHVDGETALKYARSRHSTSDFDRSRRQQQILHALGTKAKEGGMLTRGNQVLSLLGILKDHMETTLNSRQLISLAGEATKLDQDKVLMLQLNDQNGLYGSVVRPGGFLYSPPRNQFGGAFVLLPVSIPEFPVTWKQVQTLVSLFIHNRQTLATALPIDVQNASGKTGLGRTVANELLRYGFTIGEVANASDELKAQGTSFVTGPANDPDQRAAWLAGLLHLPQVTATAGSSDRLTVVLGKEFTFAPLQDLLKQQ